LQIFFALGSLSVPPNTVKSWANTKNQTTAIRPKPETTPSPGIFRSAIPKSVVRCSTKTPVSWKEPGSRRSSMRSRA